MLYSLRRIVTRYSAQFKGQTSVRGLTGKTAICNPSDHQRSRGGGSRRKILPKGASFRYNLRNSMHGKLVWQIGMLVLALRLANAAERATVVSISGDSFQINGRPTYQGRRWNGHRIEGLLLNARFVQGIFDDLNPQTAGRLA